MAAGAFRTEDVRAQHETIVHRDRDVPIDAHAVLLLGKEFYDERVRVSASHRVTSSATAASRPR
jgi:hypothetical protein